MEVPAALTVPPILVASCSRLSITSAAVSCSAFRLLTRLPQQIAGRAAWREQVNAAGWLVCGVQTCRTRRVSELQMVLQLPQSCWRRLCALFEHAACSCCKRQAGSRAACWQHMGRLNLGRRVEAEIRVCVVNRAVDAIYPPCT